MWGCPNVRKSLIRFASLLDGEVGLSDILATPGDNIAFMVTSSGPDTRQCMYDQTRSLMIFQTSYTAEVVGGHCSFSLSLYPISPTHTSNFLPALLWPLLQYTLYLAHYKLPCRFPGPAYYARNIIPQNTQLQTIYLYTLQHQCRGHSIIHPL